MSPMGPDASRVADGAWWPNVWSCSVRRVSPMGPGGRRSCLGPCVACRMSPMPKEPGGGPKGGGGGTKLLRTSAVPRGFAYVPVFVRNGCSIIIHSFIFIIRKKRQILADKRVQACLYLIMLMYYVLYELTNGKDFGSLSREKTKSLDSQLI